MNEEYENVPMLILCPMLEKSFVDNENISYYEFSIPTFFMAPMQLNQIRNMVSVYNKKHQIGEEEVVLKRLNDDIQNFNMHRTPLNCISLLEVFSNSFDENPVNRTAMIERLLRIIFENEDVPNYRSLPDVKDCEFAIGYYCEHMIRNEQYYFGSKHFYDKLSDFCKQQIITIDINYLFSILLKNQIICQYDNDLYGFRFAFWVYYFAAMRMTKSQDFANYILDKENYAHYPEVLEFYTGSDRTRNDAAQVVIEDINKITAIVHEKVGLPDKMSPLQYLRLEITDEQATKAIDKLDEELKQTKLPTTIKDALDDSNYNPEIVICDFGIAKDTTMGGSSGITNNDSDPRATYQFAPCEQVEFPAEVNQGVDIWSTFAVLFWLLTDDLPRDMSGFNNQQSLEGIKEYIKNHPARKIRSLRSDVSTELAELVDSILSRDQHIQEYSNEEELALINKLESML